MMQKKVHFLYGDKAVFAASGQPTFMGAQMAQQKHKSEKASNFTTS